MKKLETLEEMPKEEVIVPEEAPRVEKAEKLVTEVVISDAVIPEGQLLVQKGRDFLSAMSAQELVSISLPASADDGDGFKRFNIQGVAIKVPIGKIVKVPLSIASLINDIYS